MIKTISTTLQRRALILKVEFNTRCHTSNPILVRFDADRAPEEPNCIWFSRKSLSNRAKMVGISSRKEIVKKQSILRPSGPTTYLSGAIVPLT